MKKVLALLLFSLSITAMAQSATYVGKIDFGGNQLTLAFNITTNEDGTQRVTMDSPDQGAIGIEAKIEQTIGQINISIPSIGANYTGMMMGNMIIGAFTQINKSFPLTLVKIARTQTLTPPYPYTTKKVKIENKQDGVELGGTLTLPIGYDTMAKEEQKRVKLVVMVTGSGLQNRDEELFHHRPFAIIADRFARNGIATLRYDDRGIGESTGDAKKITMESNLRDAESVAMWVRNGGQFSQVGVLGHSEGANIAMMMGARNEADFVICMAGCGVGGDKILEQQNRRGLETMGIDSMAKEDFCSILRKIYAKVKQKETIIDHRGFVRELVASSPHATAVQGAETMFETLINTINQSAWMRSFISYDPAEDISMINCPAMIMNGTKDCQVESEMNIKAIRRHIPHDKKNKIVEYEGLNHLFQHAQTGSIGEYITIEETISEYVITDMIIWIQENI